MSARELFGTDLPLIQSPMAGVQDSALTIAVCEAGALGSLPCAMLDIETIQSEVATIRLATHRPFNLNFLCHSPPVHDTEQAQTWARALAPYYAEMDLGEPDFTVTNGRAPFSGEIADAVEPLRPAVVSFHFGLPDEALLARVKAWGSTIMASATTVEEAHWLEARGADVVIAQGLEAGGHRGMFLTDDVTSQLGIFALLPQVVAAVKLPVVAAGGIADARGVAAVLSLGAVAAQVGSAYLLCTEATTSQVHRAAIKSDKASHTALTNVFSGRPARGIVNRLVAELGPISDLVPEFPLASAALAPLRQQAEMQGSADFSPLWCGQNASGCREISATELTRELAARI